MQDKHYSTFPYISNRKPQAMTLLSPNPFLLSSFLLSCLDSSPSHCHPFLFLTLLSSPRLVHFPSSLLMTPVQLPSLEEDRPSLKGACSFMHLQVPVEELTTESCSRTQSEHQWPFTFWPSNDLMSSPVHGWEELAQTHPLAWAPYTRHQQFLTDFSHHFLPAARIYSTSST